MEKMNSISYFNQLIKLFEEELQIDKEQELYEKRLKSLAYRIKRGVIWAELRIVDVSENWNGDHIIVIERLKGKGTPHQFYTGNFVLLYDNNRPASTERRELQAQIISTYAGDQENDRLKLLVSNNDYENLPDWVRYSSLGLEKTTSERYGLGIKRNLKSLMKSTNPITSRLVHLLIGEVTKQTALFLEEDIGLKPDHVNEKQWDAIEKIVNCQELMVVHGPPGTGKTTTLVESIKHILPRLKAEEQILVTTPSNAAADLLTMKIAALGCPVLRVGNVNKIGDDADAYTLESLLTTHPDALLKEEIRKEYEKFRDLANQLELAYYRTGLKSNIIRAHQLKNYNLNENKTDYRDLKNRLKKKILGETQVFVTTLVNAQLQLFSKKRFAYVFIDEAGQGREPECWMPISRANRLVMFGDHLQLPPVVKANKEGEESELTKTLFEKTIEGFDASIMLTRQYRMNNMIMSIPNRCFYDGHLVADESVADHRIGEEEGDPSTAPICFYDTKELVDRFESREELSSSYLNPKEASLLMRHLEELISRYVRDGKVSFSIGIVAPYSSQVNLLKKLLKEKQLSWGVSVDVTVDTVDAFQGRERDVMYLSLVRSNERQEYGFLSESRRMNVAISRARKQLYIFGDSSTVLAAEKKQSRRHKEKKNIELFAALVERAKLVEGYQLL